MMLSVKQVAKMTGLGERTVWRRAACGDMPRPIYLGRLARWSEARLKEWLDAKQREADTAAAALTRHLEASRG